ncbi:hypothetical protein NFI96_032462 [Prochilodus magdalenae]|nr:hypothetical protein NFI96_032462 [Prochilodus magdalenae]
MTQVDDVFSGNGEVPRVKPSTINLACEHKVIITCSRRQEGYIYRARRLILIMKPYCISAIAILLFAFCSLTLSQSGTMPERCCFKENYISSPIPRNKVMRFETTSPACKDTGVIFHTVAQKQICANPNERWVMRLMKVVEKRLKSPATAISSGDGAEN